eukprot:767880-Hanusia_phi.AAC.11
MSLKCHSAITDEHQRTREGVQVNSERCDKGSVLDLIKLHSKAQKTRRQEELGPARTPFLPMDTTR